MKKTIIVTGSTSGIGYELIKEFSLQKNRVIGIARNESLMKESYKNIASIDPSIDLSFVKADLSSLEDLNKAVKEIKEMTKDNGIDVLINNAATVPHKKIMTNDGFEMQYQVNHLSGVYLTNQLLSELTKAKGIVITTTSRMHIIAKFDSNNIMGTKCYHMLRSYCRTKLYNLLFTKAFREYVSSSTGVLSFAIHPGLVKTGIGTKSTNQLFSNIWTWHTRNGKNPSEVVKTYAYIVEKKDSLDPNVCYYYESKEAIPQKKLVTMKHAEELWNITNEQMNLSWPAKK
jgi:NAD(P)-dependent dehydrogenase (short-subunit alcohol dehydrogenase family)